MFPQNLAAILPNVVTVHVDIFGALGLCLGFASGMMPRRSLILLTSAACATCFCLHYARLGALTGMTMCLISILQNLVAARFIAPHRRAGWVMPFFCGSGLVAAGLTLATWSGWPSACAGLGALLASAARLQSEARTMRPLFLGASLCWLGHNSLVGSVFGLTCDLTTILGLAIAALRDVRLRPAGLTGGAACA